MTVNVEEYTREINYLQKNLTLELESRAGIRHNSVTKGRRKSSTDDIFDSRDMFGDTDF
jgi:hypothetical protein